MVTPARSAAVDVLEQLFADAARGRSAGVPGLPVDGPRATGPRTSGGWSKEPGRAGWRRPVGRRLRRTARGACAPR
ncbi:MULTISPECIES: hypothetical protein [unclassified Streptomyces]|uniref:hypothetical protein n=1 Tax=unclassified Streptomyces TaxID=2593676 RepID=UPI0007131F5A|nr:hypothetical protein ASE41_33315 [Streptomyces sp. Root264]